MKQIIYKLERSLLDLPARQSVDQLNQLIADDFIEFGCSGTIYNKNDLIESASFETEKNYTVSDFTISELSNHVILATYKVTIDARQSLRSSIWKFNGINWQMVFHQGTNL